MKRYQKNNFQIGSSLWGMVLAMYLALPSLALADPLDLATIPLANSPTVTIQPNLLFVLDDSGSMSWDFMPDWANSSNQSLFRNASYNTVAYNPAIRYEPPAFFDAGGLNTTQYPSQTGISLASGADTTFAMPNWRKVKTDAYVGAATTNLQTDSVFFSIVAGEYCTKPDLKDCVAQTAPTATHPFPARVRWCTTSAIANAAATPAVNTCQATRVQSGTTFNNLRAPSARISTITVSNDSNSGSVDGITVSGAQILSAATAANTSSNTVATRIAQNINNCTYAMTGNCTVSGYFASASGRVVTLYASPAAAAANTVVNPVITETSAKSFTTVAFSVNSVPGQNLPAVISSTNNSYPFPGSATKASSRTDCAGTTCTFVEEMTNYANWNTYYQTRVQTMKTAASLAFKNIGEDFRVGFMTIHPSAGTSLKLNTFNTAHKAAWYSKFFSTSPCSCATPLRSALSKAGRIYAYKETISGAFTDPVEYSCQQNFTLLTTDGFWNTDASADIKDVNGAQIGDRDGGTTPRPMYEGPTASSNSLADVAKYYRDTDLRTSALGNCTGALGAPGGSVCQDPPPSTANQKQTMVTLTLGLGVDGTMAYTSDYKTALSGDFSDIKGGTKNWPVPAQDSPQAIDDLWHAAVNGEGTYFSSKNPADLTNQLKEALASVQIKVGAGAAAATSTLNPISGDNSAYVASYTTGNWTGNLEKRAIDVNTGAINVAAGACVEDVVPTSSCPAPSSVVANGVGGYDCVTPSVTDPVNCVGGTLVGTDCKVPVGTSCTGTLKNKVADFTDSRIIKMRNGSNLVDFSYGNFTPTQQATFQSAFLAANLTQWPTLSAEQQLNVTSDNLLKYLRGQTGYDENSPNPDKRVFRKRQAVLGDIIDSKPAFIGTPTFSYTDPGYTDFKTAQAGRGKTLYIGSNDGMLHAFDADTLEERWAYVPSMVIPNMWKLADMNYRNKHSYYVDGEPIISDICVGGCGGAGATWRTILVAGLNGGGRGYYALDITDPMNPSLLWEFDANNEPNLGYTFGSPIITKRPDGTWVVLVTSGYNNIPDNSAFYALPSTKFKPNNPALYTTGNGQSYLYVLDAASGAKLAEITTGVGDTSTPSGLAKIKAYADDAEKNNMATYVYGGDLLGNLWRFDINANTVLELAKLEANGIAQPITTSPELGLINNKKVVFVGTGKYLEIADLTNTNQQTLYAIKDDGTTLINPRGGALVEQTIVPSGANNRMSGSNNAVDFGTGSGWFVDLPDTGERQNVPSQLVLGTLLVPTTVPTSSVCQPAGYGWFNYFDYKTGSSVVTNPSSSIVSTRTGSPGVGFNVVYINGKPKVSIVTADNPTPQLLPDIPFSGSGTGFQGKRTIWRELIN